MTTSIFNPHSSILNPRLSIIVAMAKNRTIGINNTLPWRCPEDLKHFKALTMGHHMIMGRKTFDSIGKPLPGRTTVVVTRNQNLKIEGCIIAHSLNEAIAACAGDDEIFVVGGAELYAQALPLADKLYLTEIQQDIIGGCALSRHQCQALARNFPSISLTNCPSGAGLSLRDLPASPINPS